MAKKKNPMTSKVNWKRRCDMRDEQINQLESQFRREENAKCEAWKKESELEEQVSREQHKVRELERQLQQAKEDRNYTADFYLKEKKEIEKDRDFYKSVCRAFGKLGDVIKEETHVVNVHNEGPQGHTDGYSRGGIMGHAGDALRSGIYG